MASRGYSSTVASERVLVSSRTVTERADWHSVDWHRVDASTFEAAAAALNEVDDLDAVCAVLADPHTADPHTDELAREELVALVSMLILSGVRTFETSDPQTVKRILDTHEAIAAANIEVLAE